VDRGVPGLVHRVMVVTGTPGRLPSQLQVWVDARGRYRLSHAQVAMARELGLNPRKVGQLGNHRQEPWTAPLLALIEDLCVKRFGPVRVPRRITEPRQRSQMPKATRGHGRVHRT
jgi:hypothetical protein